METITFRVSPVLHYPVSHDFCANTSSTHYGILRVGLLSYSEGVLWEKLLQLLLVLESWPDGIDIDLSNANPFSLNGSDQVDSSVMRQSVEIIFFPD